MRSLTLSTSTLCRISSVVVAILLLGTPRTSAGNDSLLYHQAAHLIHTWDSVVTDIMMDDSHSPCVISRIYAYTNIAGYEAARPGFPQFRSLAGQLSGLTLPPQPEAGKRYDWRVAALSSMNVIDHRVLFRNYRSDSLFNALLTAIRSEGIPEDVVARSRSYGESVGRHIEAWLDQDGYRKIQASPKYLFPKGTGIWEPTPPDFVEPVDPYWSSMRPMVLTSTTQFKPDPPIPFSTRRNSKFFKAVMEVYRINKSLNDSQTLVAKFWDCNPIHSFHMGHLMFKTRQISPSGHWITITKIASLDRNLGMMESLEAYTMVSLGLFDGFLTCWTEKYRANVLRPITYIHKHIDSAWEPLLQTPPFPEHSSGHSTISASAATILTALFGETGFSDNTEVYLGMPIRRFSSFMSAAREAAISRLWGGIHYRHGNEAGTKNGMAIGAYIVKTVKTR